MNQLNPKLRRVDPCFLDCPHAKTPEGAAAAIIGLPFDSNAPPQRIGARHAPACIRAESRNLRRFLPPKFDYDAIERLGLVDCGDLDLVPGDIETAGPKIETAIEWLVSAGCRPLTLGGDGAVTLPQLRALARHHGPLALVHIDAHTDTYPIEGHERLPNATTFTVAAAEDLIDANHAIHVGARGPTDPAGVFDHTRAFGYEVIEMERLAEQGFETVSEHLVERLAGRPVFLCIDMDFFDPGIAPGVTVPVWGGASAREGLELIAGLAGLDVIAADINTVSPPHDLRGMTAFLAAHVALQCLYLMAEGIPAQE